VQAGCPDGPDDEFYHQAEEELPKKDNPLNCPVCYGIGWVCENLMQSSILSWAAHVFEAISIRS
jgi:hypothetical protein